jgi:hypothetical protein
MRVMEVLIIAYMYEDIEDKSYLMNPPFLGIEICMFLNLPDPDPSIIKQNCTSKNYLHSSRFVTFII